MACAFSLPVLLNGGFWWDFLFLWVLATGLMVLALVDLRHQYIPDGTTALVATTGLTASLTGFSVPFSDALTACFLLGTGTGLVRFLTSRLKGKEALGLGDVKLFAAAGLWVGMVGIGPLLLGSAMVGLLFHLIWNSRRATPEMPFGPCIACTLYALCIWV
jgi:leader peptidase (prepilin peptidase)/N-methyltransferase